MSSDPFELALCRGYDPNLWFPEAGARSKADIRIQVKICTECPVRDACIELAEKTGATHGIWGGYLASGDAGGSGPRKPHLRKGPKCQES